MQGRKEGNAHCKTLPGGACEGRERIGNERSRDLAKLLLARGVREVVGGWGGEMGEARFPKMVGRK